jgi:polysaccharide biosynthesis/export protein
MKKPSFPSRCALAALVLVGCATQQPRFDNEALNSGRSGNSAAPPPQSLFSTLPPPSSSRPGEPSIGEAAASQPKNQAAAPAARVTVTRTSRSLEADLLRPPTDLFVLGPGDQLDIETIGNAPYRAAPLVGLDGKIYYSFLPGIEVWGLTLGQAKSRIEEELSKYLTQPQVSVSLKAVGSKYIWLLGRVNKPAIYPLTGSMTLLEALALAGGTATSGANSLNTQDLADLRHSFVMRQGRPLPVDFVRLLHEGDMSQNIYLKPDDFVYIPSSLAQQVFVLGAVVGPHAIPYTENMTVVSAIASVGGVVRNAYVSHVGVVRGSLSQPQLITVNYGDIIRGKTQNVPLEAGDIVYVPLTPYHILSDYADLIVTTFARAWSANIGVRAVEGSTTVGVSVPVGTTTITR